MTYYKSISTLSEMGVKLNKDHCPKTQEKIINGRNSIFTNCQMFHVCIYLYLVGMCIHG